MNSDQHIRTIRFRRYKAFEDFSISFGQFNVLVGPNNAGKSTVLGALRLLAEGIRKARSRNPVLLAGPTGNTRGYIIDLSNLPLSTENVFHNYDESEPAIITFKISNGNELILHFPERGSCHMFALSAKSVRSTNDFKREFDLKISFVPVLGPVEHDERLYAPEAARSALLSHGASRNFRNIWYHFPGGFDEFKLMIKQTWPGMDIKPPELSWNGDHQMLRMFCPEERVDREIFWAGFGFQVWCQMLTFILQAKDSSLLVIDEPDIYLHSDLQRQLVSLLHEVKPNVILATHSTEIISEVDSDCVLNINKRFKSAKRIHNTRELQSIFSILGSNLNPTLTQLAKTKRVVFVEGKDFLILARFARKLGAESVANRSSFAVVPVQGFNPRKVKDFSQGMEETLGSELLKMVIFDRDYRGDAEVKFIEEELSRFCWHAVVHKRKEIENFLLHPSALANAIRKKLSEKQLPFAEMYSAENIPDKLLSITDFLKNEVQSQFVASAHNFEKNRQSGMHASSSSRVAMDQFDSDWGTFEGRMKILPGKQVLSLLNAALQSEIHVVLTPAIIIDCFPKADIFDHCCPKHD